jgi:hypothetical protein
MPAARRPSQWLQAISRQKYVLRCFEVVLMPLARGGYADELLTLYFVSLRREQWRYIGGTGVEPADQCLSWGALQMQWQPPRVERRESPISSDSTRYIYMAGPCH